MRGLLISCEKECADSRIRIDYHILKKEYVHNYQRVLTLL